MVFWAGFTEKLYNFFFFLSFIGVFLLVKLVRSIKFYIHKSLIYRL